MPLSRGQFAIIDVDDAQRVLAHKWHALCSDDDFYAARTIRDEKCGQQKRVLMHRFIIDAPLGSQVDHVNGNPLDNRKANLRLATSSQNSANKGTQRNNRSGFKGVYWHKCGGGYAATIHYQKRSYYLGLFTTPEEAALAYDAAARRLHGEFARLNFTESEGSAK